MNKALLSLFIFLNSLTTHGQNSINNFQIEEDKVIWQKVYETDLTQKEFINQIKNNGIFDNTAVGSLEITGDIKQINADFKGAGYSEMLSP